MRSWLKSSKMDLTLITRVYLGSYLKSHSRPGLIGTLPYMLIMILKGTRSQNSQRIILSQQDLGRFCNNSVEKKRRKAEKSYLEWLSEAESALIRSASKFCFDLDVRIFFQLFQKIFFRSIQRWGPHFFGEISNP